MGTRSREVLLKTPRDTILDTLKHQQALRIQKDEEGEGRGSLWARMEYRESLCLGNAVVRVTSVSPKGDYVKGKK